MPETMRFEYTYRNTPGDYWRFYHGNTYHSTMGIVYIAFTTAMVALIASKWNMTNGLGKALMVIGVLVFPVIQPLVTYFKSIRDAVTIQADTNLAFDEHGLKINVCTHTQQIPWRDFHSVIKRNTMLVVIPDGLHAYLIPNRILGSEKQKLYTYSTEMIAKYSTKQADRREGSAEKKADSK